MRLCRNIEEIRTFTNSVQREGKTVGLVPTMGYLHQGHLTLAREAKARCDIVVLSIFVNPTQFGPKEDFTTYPRDIQRDAALAREAGVDVIFAPETTAIYPQGFSTFVDVEGISGVLCGASRPGHFRGVATVVTKLLNIVRPNLAFFGQKDFQQLLVIKRLVQDLNLPVQIMEVAIVREPDGLAMSSRNVYLSPEQRKAATVLYKSLELAQSLVEQGERSIPALRDAVIKSIQGEPLAQMDYVEILTLPDLQNKDIVSDRVLLALAVKFGSTRLIDNRVLEVR